MGVCFIDGPIRASWCFFLVVVNGVGLSVVFMLWSVANGAIWSVVCLSVWSAWHVVSVVFELFFV